MKKMMIMFVFILCCGGAYASCPTGWEEIPMENFTITSSTGSCPAGTESYYHIDTQCNANVL